MWNFVQEHEPDIIAISETHLRLNENFQIKGYEWVGNNYYEAARGCRGVGFLIKEGI